MFNLDDFRNKNSKEHNLHWPYIPGNLYAILIIGGRGPGKANPLLHLIKEEDKNILIKKLFVSKRFTSTKISVFD